MAIYTVTIRSFLLSRFKNNFDEPNGQGLDENGDFYHMNEIIDQTYNEPFKNMKFNVDIDSIFKKEFCKRFYNREIGRETWAQFEGALESCINTECFNKFRVRKDLMNMAIKDSIITNNSKSKSKSTGKGKQLASSTPGKNLNIVYPGVTGDIIKYADAISENYGGNDAESTLIGSNTAPLFELLNYHANITPIDQQIFNIMDCSIFNQAL